MNLQVAIADVADCQKELTIEIGANEVQDEYNKVYSGFARYAKVPGFREGKAPRAVIKQRFSKEIKNEVMRQLVPYALGHVIEDHKLRVISEPTIEGDDIVVKEGEPLKFTSRIYVLPEFELKNYKGLQLTRRIAQVTDESVEKVIEDLRDKAAQLVPVEDRLSQAGDFVFVNLVGKYIDPVEEEDLKNEDLMVELGAEGVHPDFEANLTGVKEGDVREFTVKYPEDFQAQGLAGKTLAFTATVNAVKSKELPELDDEFAQEIADEYNQEYTTLEEMRAQVRENLIANAEAEAEAGLRDQLLSVLAQDYDFPLPAPLVERQANSRLNSFVQQLFRSGLPPQAMRQINWEERKAFELTNAVVDVRIALLLRRIAEAEQITVTQDELDEEMERIAEAVGQSPEQVEARLTKEDSMSSIESRLQSDKVIDFLISQAEIATEEFDPQKAIEPPPDSSNQDEVEGIGESA